MDDWYPPESWKRITCIMMICAGHQKKEIMVAAQCSLNTVKTIRHELENCNGDYETVARRKQHTIWLCSYSRIPRKSAEKSVGGPSDAYVELLNTVVQPWITKVANGRPNVWQQDSAPCHTSGKSKKWLSARFYDYTSPNVWPPNSPDLNTMDYYVCGAVEKDTNCHASTTKSQLIDRIKVVFETLPISLLQVLE